MIRHFGEEVSDTVSHGMYLSFPLVQTGFKMKEIVVCSLVLIVFACTAGPDHRTSPSETGAEQMEGTMQYAVGFTLARHQDYTYITVMHPWKKDDTLATYCITFDSISDILPEADFTITQVPEKIASLSSTSIGMLKILGQTSRVSASAYPHMICDRELYNRYQQGKITDLGETRNLNAEIIIGHRPDLVVKYIYGTVDAADSRICDAGIPVAYNLEFMEPHPLGRAEWLKFLAAFTGQDAFADSVFQHIREEYLHWSSEASLSDHRPTVMDGASYKGVWYAAGGNSFPARLYKDAGAAYFWQNDTSRGTLTLSIESVIEAQQNADFWITTRASAKEEMLHADSRYHVFESFRNNNVFHFNKRMNPNGGSDYFELGVVRPDILLKDLISVFHPELLPEDYERTFLDRVN